PKSRDMGARRDIPRSIAEPNTPFTSCPSSRWRSPWTPRRRTRSRPPSATPHRPAASGTARFSSWISSKPSASAPARPAWTRSRPGASQGEKQTMTAFKTPKVLGLAAVTALLVALPALGQDAEVVEEVAATVSEGVSADVVFVLNPFLLLFGGVLAMWMAAGLAVLAP